MDINGNESIMENEPEVQESELASEIIENLASEITENAENATSNITVTLSDTWLNSIISSDVLPKNSESLCEEESTVRFSNAIWYDMIQDQDVTLVGLGGIGSYVAFLLSRLKINWLYTYDPDIVEEVNLGGQLYRFSDVGKRKAEASRNLMANYSNYFRVYLNAGSFTADNHCNTNIMICGLDNMSSRKICFEAWLNRTTAFPLNRRGDCLYIDGRLAAEEFQVFCIRGDDNFNIDRYQRDYLFTDEESLNTICSYKQTSYMSNMIGSVIINLFVNFIANRCSPDVCRALPFFTFYSADTMFLKTEL